MKRLLCDAGFHSELRISGIIGNIRFFLLKKYVLSADIRASQPFAVTKTLIFDQKLVFSGKNLAGRGRSPQPDAFSGDPSLYAKYLKTVRAAIFG